MKQLNLQKTNYWNRNLGDYYQPYKLIIGNFRLKNKNFTPQI